MSLVQVVLYVLKLSCQIGKVLGGCDTVLFVLLTPASCLYSSCGVFSVLAVCCTHPGCLFWHLPCEHVYARFYTIRHVCGIHNSSTFSKSGNT